MNSQLSKCINCTKTVVKEYFPFCSERCKNIDLYKWMSGSYVIAGEDQKDTK